jgi:hypothetical protein
MEQALNVPYAWRHDFNHGEGLFGIAKVYVLIRQHVSMGTQLGAHLLFVLKGLSQHTGCIVVPPHTVQDAAEQSEQPAKLSMIPAIGVSDEGANEAFRFCKPSSVNVIPGFSFRRHAFFRWLGWEGAPVARARHDSSF